jgi:hypothetical protein
VAELVKDVSCLCCISGTVSARLGVNKRCFVPGETVIITCALIENGSNRAISGTWISLEQAGIVLCVLVCLWARSATAL